MYNCPALWYTVVDEMSVDEMSIDELSWNPYKMKIKDQQNRNSLLLDIPIAL